MDDRDVERRPGQDLWSVIDPDGMIRSHDGAPDGCFTSEFAALAVAAQRPGAEVRKVLVVSSVDPATGEQIVFAGAWPADVISGTRKV